MHPPIIDPGFLSDSSDVDRLVASLQHALELSRSHALEPWISGPTTTPGLDAPVQAKELRQWVRANAVTHNHIAGSCRMGIDELAVVYPSLRVRGTEGLRVVDVSVMPRIVSGHCQGAVLAIAERAADLVSPDAASER